MSKKAIYSSAMSRRRSPQAWANFVCSVVCAPRFRRYIVVYVVFVCLCLGSWVGIAWPWLREDKALRHALDIYDRKRIGGWFGANALPEFLDMVHMRALDPSLLPGADGPDSRRLVVIGDVHGCSDELERLLHKISFDRKGGDHLVFTGDLITKGPKSVETVRLARSYSASCVRGNHDDRVLLTRREITSTTIAGSSGMVKRSSLSNEEISSLPEARDRLLAQDLSNEDAEWLGSCPVILKLGEIGNMGEVVAVHAGLIPGVSLDKQDPTTTMTMRTIDVNSHVPSASYRGINWARLFNEHQKRLVASSPQAAPPSAQPTTVIYGHDSQRYPAIKTYTKGLDTGCVHGGKLTALIIEDDGVSHTEQVRCRDYTGSKSRWFKLPYLPFI